MAKTGGLKCAPIILCGYYYHHCVCVCVCVCVLWCSKDSACGSAALVLLSCWARDHNARGRGGGGWGRTVIVTPQSHGHLYGVSTHAGHVAGGKGEVSPAVATHVPMHGTTRAGTQSVAWQIVVHAAAHPRTACAV